MKNKSLTLKVGCLRQEILSRTENMLIIAGAMALKFWSCREECGNCPEPINLPCFCDLPITPHWPLSSWMILKPWNSYLRFVSTMITGLCHHAWVRQFQLHLVRHQNDGMSNMSKNVLTSESGFHHLRRSTEISPDPWMSYNRHNHKEK